MAEPSLKRQHLDEILYKINHGSLRVFTPGPDSIKIYHITSTISLKEDVLVKHRGKVLSPLDCIPCTNAEDPLIFITEVGLAVQVNNDLKKKITCPPTITLGDLLLDINAGDHVALLEGAVVKNNTFIHTLFEKTSIDCCLHVVSEVSVKVDIIYAHRPDERLEMTVRATSSVSDVVDKFKSFIQVEGSKWKLDCDKVAVKHDGNTVDVKVPVVNFSLDLPFSFAYKLSGAKEKLQNCAELTTPTSKYGGIKLVSTCNKASDFCAIPILNHREGEVGNDVSLYYSEFQDFMDNCDQVKPTSEDYSFALELCIKMAKHYNVELDRKNALVEVLQKYFPKSNIDVSKTGDSKCDIMMDDYIYIELKNEVGTGGADSFPECLSYYIRDLQYRPYDVCSLPAFIIEVVGPNLFISGAVFGEGIYVDRLATLWLTPQTQNNLAMLKIARVLASFRKAVESITQFYNNLRLIENPRFPAFNQNGGIKYEAQLKPHLFKGTFNGARVVIKFCDAYCEEAHLLLHSIDRAPMLHLCQPVTSRFKMIVMEFVEGRHLNEFLSQETDKKQSILDQCTHALTKLHDENLCHGDFRDLNVLVRENGTVCILDYEWAGLEGEVRYPGFMNHVHITWPDGASDGELIRKEHDIFMMEHSIKLQI